MDSYLVHYLLNLDKRQKLGESLCLMTKLS